MHLQEVWRSCRRRRRHGSHTAACDGQRRPAGRPPVRGRVAAPEMMLLLLLLMMRGHVRLMLLAAVVGTCNMAMMMWQH